MAIEDEPVRREKIFAQLIEVCRRYFRGSRATLAHEVSVDCTREVVHGCTLAEVCVHHDTQLLEFVENTVNRGGTDVRSLPGYRARDLLGG